MDLQDALDLAGDSGPTSTILPFHEDPSGHHLDVRFTDDFERHRVATAPEQEAVVARVRQALEG